MRFHIRYQLRLKIVSKLVEITGRSFIPQTQKKTKPYSVGVNTENIIQHELALSISAVLCNLSSVTSIL